VIPGEEGVGELGGLPALPAPACVTAQAHTARSILSHLKLPRILKSDSLSPSFRYTLTAGEGAAEGLCARGSTSVHVALQCIKGECKRGECNPQHSSNEYSRGPSALQLTSILCRQNSPQLAVQHGFRPHSCFWEDWALECSHGVKLWWALTTATWVP
jgi:hypothetical protein